MKRKKKEIQIDPDAMAETALKVFADAALMLEVASREHYRRHDDHAAHADELVGRGAGVLREGRPRRGASGEASHAAGLTCRAG